MATVFEETVFQAALVQFRAGSDAAADVLYGELRRLADYLVRRLRVRSHDAEDAAADGVARCFEYLHSYDSGRSTAYNYFAQVIASRLLNESARAGRRCQLLDRLTADPPAATVDATADSQAAGAEVLTAVADLDGHAALVARALLYGGATLDSHGAVNVAGVRRLTGLTSDQIAVALADLREQLQHLADDISSRQ